MSENKTGRYLKYAIGEIILVVIGILIALQINNWNENNKEEKQIRNIFNRVVLDFENNSVEIKQGLQRINNDLANIEKILTNAVSKDSLANNSDYFNELRASFGGFEDIKIKHDGVDLLKTKIQNKYELNDDIIEELLKLYSENLYEIDVDRDDLTRTYIILSDYVVSTGSNFEYDLKADKTKLIELLLDDDTFKIYLNEYDYILSLYQYQLERFLIEGQQLIEKIKANYVL